MGRSVFSFISVVDEINAAIKLLEQSGVGADYAIPALKVERKSWVDFVKEHEESAIRWKREIHPCTQEIYDLANSME